MASIDRETAHTTVHVGDGIAVPSSITVVASSPGLTSATIEIPVSADAEHGVLHAAARSVHEQQTW